MKRVLLLVILLFCFSSASSAAIYFDGSNDYLYYGSGMFTANQDGYTMAARFSMPDATPAGDAIISYTARTGIMFLRVNPTGLTGFSYAIGGTWYTVLGTTTLQNDTDYVLVCVWQKGGRCYVYLNTEDVTSGTPSSPDAYLATTTVNSSIGAANGGAAAPWGGTLKELYWYDRALTAAEVKLLSSKRRRIGLQIDDFAEYMPLDEYPEGTELSGLSYHDVFDSAIVWTGAGGTSLVQVGEDVFSY